MAVADAVRVATEGMTQKQVAAVLGLEQSDVSKLFSGYQNRRFSLDQIATIEGAVGRPRGFILTLAGYVTSAGAKEAEKLLRRTSAEVETYDALVEQLRDRVRRGR